MLTGRYIWTQGPGVPSVSGNVDTFGLGRRHKANGASPPVYCSNLTLSAASVKKAIAAKDDDAAERRKREITNLNNFIANTSKN